MRSLIEIGQVWTNDSAYKGCRFTITGFTDYIDSTAMALFTDASGLTQTNTTGFAMVDTNHFTTMDIESGGWYQIFISPEEKAKEEERQKQARAQEEERLQREAHAEKYL